MKRTLSLLFGMAGFVPLVLDCTADLAGGTIETTNGYAVGLLVDSTGAPASNVRVTLVPVSYDPQGGAPLPASYTDTTAADGRYTLRTSSTGLYNIVAVRLTDGSMALACSVGVQRNDTFAAPVDTLEAPGAVKVIASPSWDTANGYVFVQGTTFSAAIAGGAAIMGAVPAGQVPVVCYGEKSTSVMLPVREGVRVVSADTVTVRNPGWRFSRSLFLNTTASGAQVAGDVYGFPVLVRLDSSNFSFGNARGGGADVRFAKFDGAPLPYEIGRWDGVTERAEVWVRVDTVYGNNSFQCIVMYWGNPAALNTADPVAVFDTAGGFQGVWHLDENGNSAAGGYADATANRCLQTGSPGMAQYANVNGIIGRAQRFSGDSTSISGPAPSKISGNSSFSVSFWMNYSSPPVRSWVLYFGDYQAELQMCHFLIGSNDTAQFGLSGGPAVPDSSAQNVFDLSNYAGVWSFVTTVYDASGGVLTTYMDGVPVAAHPVLAADIIPSGGMHIGRKSPNHAVDIGYFGLLDELRICSRTVSADWIKLSYMNQKAQDALVNGR